MTAYRPFLDQTIHYFMRDHQALPTEPVSAAADWRGPEIQANSDRWIIQLTADQLSELESAVHQVRSRNLTMEAITRDKFELPGLSKEIQTWRSEIQCGRGFVVVRGLPVDKWGVEFSSIAYWGLGHHLGLPGAQNPQNELLGHVVDYGEERDNPNVRRYRTSGNIDFHCDAADVVGLLCLRPAKSGGQSRIVSSVAIFNALYESRPDLIYRLFEPFALDRRGEEGEGEAPTVPIPPCRWTKEGGLKTFYHSEYFRSSARHDSVHIDADAEAILDFYDRYCVSPDFYLDMWLESGDMQFLSNHCVMHSRTAYEDWESPDKKRHLLRLWLSL